MPSPTLEAPLTTRDNTCAHDRERAAKIETMQVCVEEALASGPLGPFDFDAFLAKKRGEHGNKG